MARMLCHKVYPSPLLIKMNHMKTLYFRKRKGEVRFDSGTDALL